MNTLAIVTASSEQPDHPAGHAVDDDPKGETCYHSNMSSHSWWKADIGSEKFLTEIVIHLKVEIVYVCACVCICVCSFVCVCMYVCLSVYMCMHMQVYILMYMVASANIIHYCHIGI